MEANSEPEMVKSLFSNLAFFDDSDKPMRDRRKVKEFMKGAEYEVTGKLG